MKGPSSVATLYLLCCSYTSSSSNSSSGSEGPERRPRSHPAAAPVAAPVAVASAVVGTESLGEWNDLMATFAPQPVHFATENSSTITAQTGSKALIPCVVNNIGDGMVSWIRRKDYHLLTVGLTTYTGDERYQAIHAQHSEDWTLQIKFVQQRDAGLYECQVSSHPPTSIFIELKVVEARAEISGPAEKYLKLGSTLRLVCTLVSSTEPPVYVFWYHNNRMINYDGDRGVNVTKDLPSQTSTLLINSASPEHSGNYSCVPSNAQPASTYVHILNGENPAAMQHGGRGLSWLHSPSAWLLLACVVVSVLSGRLTFTATATPSNETVNIVDCSP
ncbi:zwei Ig domain protein zig-8 isoform X2 [Cryptotermes secundus]|uniref:zwei Ig domain protein zig-8 isoform X2 n=1 Tax=Cryptotermes secundus TaxID=105785 RepID=UPI000CD7DC43|nr:zwei Ig domain protein zig-8 isoform X2 [Cryptotermes secundus]